MANTLINQIYTKDSLPQLVKTVQDIVAAINSGKIGGGGGGKVFNFATSGLAEVQFDALDRATAEVAEYIVHGVSGNNRHTEVLLISFDGTSNSVETTEYALLRSNDLSLFTCNASFNATSNIISVFVDPLTSNDITFTAYQTVPTFGNQGLIADTTFALFAENANNANHAGFANSASFAEVANTANSANFANTANTADVANFVAAAIFANTANVANTANSALFANTANSALFANTANNANTANTATYALHLGGFHNDGFSGSAKTIDWSVTDSQELTLNANCTLTFANGVDGQRYLLCVHSGAGSFTLTQPLDVLWPDNREPVMSQPPNKTDLFVYTFVLSLNKYLGTYSQYYG
jgi:hypothetical protein